MLRAGGGGPRSRGRQSENLDLCQGPGGGGPGGGRYRRSVLETSLLALLAESTTHGYDLMEQIEALAGDLICIDPGTVYRLLRAMEEQGWVSSSWETPQSGPSRRVYTLNPEGLEALEASARSLAERARALERLANHAAAAANKARQSPSAGGEQRP